MSAVHVSTQLEIPKPVRNFMADYVSTQNAHISEAQRRANIAQEEYEAMQKEIEAHKTNIVAVQSFVSKVGEVFT